jgi:hypothetical protein
MCIIFVVTPRPQNNLECLRNTGHFLWLVCKLSTQILYRPYYTLSELYHSNFRHIPSHSISVFCSDIHSRKINTVRQQYPVKNRSIFGNLQTTQYRHYYISSCINWFIAYPIRPGNVRCCEPIPVFKKICKEVSRYSESACQWHGIIWTKFTSILLLITVEWPLHRDDILWRFCRQNPAAEYFTTFTRRNIGLSSQFVP